METYSMDRRERVMAAHDAGDAMRAEIAERFSVSVLWIRDLVRLRRETGSIAPRSHGGGCFPAFDAAAAHRLREAVKADPDATLEELAQAAGVECSPSIVHRALKREGITRKKSPAGRPSKTGRG
ncbi:IS630 transposase-related protein [Singulisphaera sp. PoT]|uniref:IS630 transposase-related protein n=1 Tax=Singulisphaera sp. PoT TaxID=3411797 RepID=UPI003BF55E4E